jgi:uncharacterized protein (TIGR02270 family)
MQAQGMRGHPGVPVAMWGFQPEELSGLSNRHVLLEHASEAAFLWRMREQAALAPHYDLGQLARLDGRLAGHLQGLRHGGVVAWSLSQGLLEDLSPGTLFVATVLAAHLQQGQALAQTLALALSDPALAPPFVQALVWSSATVARPVLQGLWSSPVSAHQCLALQALVWRREATAEHCQQALRASDPTLRQWAWRGAGELGGEACAILLRAVSAETDPLARCWAWWSAARYGMNDAAQQLWQALGPTPGEADGRQFESALRWGPVDWARDQARALLQAPGQMRAGIQALGAVGDAAAVPWLIEQTRVPELARLAGEAISRITGVDIRRADLHMQPELAGEADHAGDVDLPRPDTEALLGWWSAHAATWPRGRRSLWGQAIDGPAVVDTLRRAPQRHRAAAAQELARLTPQHPMFNVVAPAHRQKARLAT